MEKSVYISPEAEFELLNAEDVVLVSVDKENTLDIDKENSVHW